MSDNRPVYCPKCKELIPDGRGRCPTCGGSPVYLLEIGRPPEKKVDTSIQNMAIIALSVLLVVVGFRFVLYPNLPVVVEQTIVSVCSESDKIVEEKIISHKTTRNQASNFQVYTRKMVDCNEDSSDNYDSLSTNDIEIKRDSAVKPRGSGYGDDIAYIKKDMTHSQVLTSWGEPLAVEKMEINDKRVERWVYGDPLYGIRVTSRYVDFHGDAVGELYLEREMLELYENVIAERRSR